MGQRRTRLERLKLDHPNCCFCGGEAPTETVEHAPPKVFFKDKHRLKGLEFPACFRCNLGSSQLDQVASWVAVGMGAALLDDGLDPYWQKLSRGVQNNTPEVLDFLEVRRAEAIWWRTQVGSIDELYKVPVSKELFTKYLNPWAAKQGIALWYHHTGRILSDKACVWTRWITNFSILEAGAPKIFEGIDSDIGYLSQGRRESSSEFLYEFAINADDGLAAFLIGAHSGSCFVVLISDPYQPGLVEGGDYGEVFATNRELGIHKISPTRA